MNVSSELPGAAPKTIRVTFKMVGPVTRSTLERDDPDPEWERLSDLRYWCTCLRLQMRRLAKSLEAPFPAKYSFRAGFEASYDEHCLLVAAGNLDRSLRRFRGRARKDYQFPPPTQRALRLLRNIYEHWDELRESFRHGTPSGAVEKLARKFPEAEPWSIVICPDGDFLLAGVVSLRSLVRDVRRLEAKAWWGLRELRRQGRHLA